MGLIKGFPLEGWRGERELSVSLRGMQTSRMEGLGLCYRLNLCVSVLMICVRK
jgi:hypothetical protein